MKSVLTRSSLGMVAGTTLLLLFLALSAQRPIGVSGPPPEIVGAPEVTLAGGLLDGHLYTEPLGPVQNDLSEVGIYVDSNNHRTLAPLEMLLLDSGQVVRRAVTTVKPTSDLARFAFAPITDSNRRGLVAQISAVGADDRTMVSLFVVQNPAPGVPRLLRDGQDTGGYAPFRLRYGAPARLSDQLREISDRASQYRPGPFKTPVPLLTAGLALALSAALLAGVIRPGPGRTGG